MVGMEHDGKLAEPPKRSVSHRLCEGIVVERDLVDGLQIWAGQKVGARRSDLDLSQYLITSMAGPAASGLNVEGDRVPQTGDNVGRIGGASALPSSSSTAAGC